MGSRTMRAAAEVMVLLGTLAMLAASGSAQKLSAAAERLPSRAELESFDDFLDAHGNVARVLRRNPAIAENEDFLNNHPELDEFLKNHPGVEQELREAPARFVQREKRFSAAGEHVSRYELDTFDHLLDQHPEAAAELRNNPGLADDRDFLGQHADLREFFEDHPQLRENLKQRPWAFLTVDGLEPHEHEEPVVYRPKH
jgi:phage-related protein